jgi:hypothetical protein
MEEWGIAAAKIHQAEMAAASALAKQFGKLTEADTTRTTTTLTDAIATGFVAKIVHAINATDATNTSEPQLTHTPQKVDNGSDIGDMVIEPHTPRHRDAQTSMGGFPELGRHEQATSIGSSFPSLSGDSPKAAAAAPATVPKGQWEGQSWTSEVLSQVGSETDVVQIVSMAGSESMSSSAEDPSRWDATREWLERAEVFGSGSRSRLEVRAAF